MYPSALSRPARGRLAQAATVAAVTAAASLSLLHCAPRQATPADSPGAASSPDASPAARVLDRYKQATGGAAWDALRVIRVHGSVHTGGLDGALESYEDLLGGRHQVDFQLGPMKISQGYDGRDAWTRDQSGSVHVADAAHTRAAVATEAHRTARAYWYPDRHPAQIRLGEPVTEDGRRFDVVHLEPEGGRAYQMWFDPDSGLLTRVVEPGTNDVTTTTLDDYREVGGVRLPHQIRVSTGEAQYDQLITITQVELDPAVDPAALEARFARPADQVDDVVIADGKDTVRLPFELHNNHIYVEGRINGQGPVRLLVDTGGANVLTPEAAKALGIEAEGAMQARGVGSESVDLALARVDELTLGDVQLSDQVFYVIDLGRLGEIEDVPFVGLVGFEVFKRFAVTIDYAGGALTLQRPETFEYRGDGAAIPFVFDHHTPQIEGVLDGRPGVFTVDTGSRGALTLLAPFVAEHGLLDAYAPTVEALTGWGVGGPVYSHLAHGRELVLGDMHIPDVAMDLFTGDRGAFAGTHAAGNIGGGVLKRFTVTFDYSRQVMYLDKNQHFDAPDRHDQSGLWMSRTDAGFAIEAIVPGSAAERAGLAVGDHVVAVDGRAVTELSLSDVRTHWRRAAPGTRVRLRVASKKGKQREVVMVLRALI
ncbi:aspartyl protease family protein [Haliangium sp.]|uniref:aspartyl protease family protein n=1 Tax=Haliangium sp. TaxID=2663208 RepID=UPI003D0FC3C4